ncbi:MAG: hypothetical protein E4G96_11130 [Chrysiogenales bacterium]|nr:MAG: hypothetical protein E4G96_11130 [Chrysiogenales bacterium]
MPGPGIPPAINKMAIDIDAALYGLRVKLASLVTAIISTVQGSSHDVDALFSRWVGEACIACRCLSISLDDDVIRLAVEGCDGPIEWDDIDVAGQYRIAQGLYTRYFSDAIYRSLS